MFDKDKNGNISEKELYKMMKAIGTPISREEIKTILNSLDKSGDNEINFEEFCHFSQILNDNKNSEEREDIEEEITTYKPTLRSKNIKNEENSDIMLTGNTKEEIKAAFNEYSSENNDIIMANDLISFLDNIGYHISSSKLNEIMNKVQNPKKNNVSFDELLKIIQLIEKDINDNEDTKRNREKIRELKGNTQQGKEKIIQRERAYYTVDFSERGNVGKEEFEYILKQIGYQLSPNEIKRLFSEADNDNDAGLNSEEFIDFWKNFDSKNISYVQIDDKE